MLQNERHNQILTKLNLEGQVKVNDLAKEFNVTKDCIRKDLTILEKEEKLKRVHGGAINIRKNVHIYNVNERVDIRLKEKQEIALKAIELISNNSTIFLDISTINLEIAKLIFQKDLNITVITNMIDIMQVFRSYSSTRVIFIGGDFNHARDGFVGATTINQIHNYKFDIAFIGTVGMDVSENKVFTYETNDGLTKLAAIRNSKKSYIVSENEKFKMDGNYVFASFEDISGIISENTLNDNLINKMNKYNIEII